MVDELIRSLSAESSRLSNLIAREPKALRTRLHRIRQQKSKVLRYRLALKKTPTIEVIEKAISLLDRQYKEHNFFSALENLED
jgi:hypothetical protein